MNSSLSYAPAPANASLRASEAGRARGLSRGFALLPWFALMLLFLPSSLAWDRVAAHPVGPLKIVIHFALIFLPWVGFAGIIGRVLARFPLAIPPSARALVVHLAHGAVLLGLHCTLLTALDAAGLYTYAREAIAFPKRLSFVLLYTGAFDVILYIAVVVVFSASKRIERYHAREEGMVRAQLDALRAQLQPHFLFNALNALSELVYDDAAAADRVIRQLASLLRRFVEQKAHEHTLGEELAVVREYLAIHGVLLGERLQVRLDVPDTLTEARVPTLLLQPLVENAIQHGVARLRGGGSIALTVSRRDKELFLELENDAPTTREPPMREGLGLPNTRARLEALYGSRQSMQFDVRKEGGARVTITLPFQT